MPQTGGDAPILATKLFVPPPRERLVPRLRLRERLAAARGGRVTLIAAAAGWGKSTLLADWALEATGRVAWLSLDPGDDEPRRFLNYVIATLRSAQCISADELLDALSSHAEAVQTAATELLNAVAFRGAPVALVLDDYHVIKSRAVHDVVQFVIDHLPPNLHLVVATRADPPLALSRLRARGMLLEIRGDDLRFTEEETGAFLNGAMGLTLGSSDIRELERRTEGWVVGLQMAAISLSGREGAQGFIERFSGSNRYVLDYLTDEVLDRQSEGVRSFLLCTSILGRLSAPLCDAVMERTDSERVLEELEAANLFLIPLDDVRYWYRYHHLFASLLQHHLGRTHDADAIAGLHRRAAAWYAANRMPESALEHALSAKDVDRAIGILAAHSLARTLGGDMASVVRWFDMLPQARIEGDINLLLSRTMALLGDWQLPRAHDTAVKAAELVRDDTPPEQRGAILALRGTLERTIGKVDEGNENLRRSLPLVEDGTFWSSFAHYQLGMIAMTQADAGRMVTELEPVRVRPVRPDLALVPVLAQTYSAYGEWWRGHPDNAIALARELFSWIDVIQDVAPERPLDCLPNGVLADVHCSLNDLDTAREFAERAKKHARSGIMLGLFEASRSYAHVVLAQREWELAGRAVSDMQRAVRNVGTRFYWTFGADALANMLLFRRWQANGDGADLQAVEKWMRANELPEKQMDWTARRSGGYYCDSPLLLAARVLIEHEQYVQAGEVLEAVLPNSVQTQRLLAEIETLIILSILEARRGRVDEAVAHMKRALDRASAPCYIRLFADDGPDIRPIVERAASAVLDRDFATRVLASFESPASAARPAAPEALSEREIEVLRLIAAGNSNQEAARKLFIASSTVKKHLENIYAKFGVGGRVEAIARAREMNLL